MDDSSESQHFSIFSLLVSAFDTTTLVASLLLIVLIVLSGLVSGSEIALFYIADDDLEKSSTFTSNSIRRIKKLLQKPYKLLATILILNNLINVSIVLLFSFIFTHQLHLEEKSALLALFINVVVSTLVITFFGEIFPKVLAQRVPLWFSDKVSYLIYLFFIVLQPLTYLLTSLFPYSKKNIRTASSLPTTTSDMPYTPEEISYALERTALSEAEHQEPDEVISENAETLLKGIAYCSIMRVYEIMSHRSDMCAVQSTDTFREALVKVEKFPYSRIPIMNDDGSKVVGILYVKDLLLHADKSEFDWLSLQREPFYVPKHKYILSLLNEFRLASTHMGVVVDENGDVQGLVTFEDIMEEIVGEIHDESDSRPKNMSVSLGDDSFLFDAQIPLTDFCEKIKISPFTIQEDRGDASTLGGLILHLSDKNIEAGVSMDYNEILFEITEVEEDFPTKVKVKKLKQG